MITAGIDVGAKTVKIVLLKDGKEIVGQAMVPAGTEVAEAIEAAWSEVFGQSGMKLEDIEAIAATGAGKEESTRATKKVTEVGADAKGASLAVPEARTVIDVGAEEGRAIKVDGQGKVVDFAINEKCAAGAGAFTEAMARALEVPIEELGPLSLKSTQDVAMNAQCAVFAESELVTLVHNQTPKPDMARAIHNAIADRIVSMVRRVGMEEKVALLGGVSHNIGFVDSLEKELGTKVIIPDNPEYISALGAAIVAAEGD